MALLHVSEYGGLAQTSGGVSPLVHEPPLAKNNVTFTVAAAGAAFGNNTRIVEISCLVAAYLEFGNPASTATIASALLPAGVVIYKEVSPGHNINVYDGSS